MIFPVVSKDGKPHELKEAYVEEGLAINSGEYDGLATTEFKEKISGTRRSRSRGTIPYTRGSLSAGKSISLPTAEV